MTDEETIEISRDDQVYRPLVGEETLSVLDKIPVGGRETVRDEALDILGKCVRPDGSNGVRTGLVVGYVQSGKTASFTTVTALARDNGYPIVIVIAGTSIALTDQSKKRLRRDLRLESREDYCWLHLHNPSTASQDHAQLRDLIDEWSDPSVDQYERRTALITVMKHHVHLNNLINVLHFLDLTNYAVLVIDDEADQAGLNNLTRQHLESTTYTRLANLKAILPNHTFLQYTATPQGPLLINMIDVLSPEFASTITPGQEYTGGSEFFREQGHLIRIIPLTDIPGRNQPLAEPPNSLLQALRLFYLGVAVNLVRRTSQQTISMMIHPSFRTASHEEYYRIVQMVEQQWRGILDNQYTADYQDLLEDFESAYDDLRGTVENLELFEEIVPKIKHAMRRTRLHLVNAVQGRTPEIDWRSHPAHILVGGTALDRGFTVKGLTVTYMPRGVGVGNVDTIQQRARFYGYKQQYIDFCRVFLEIDVADAFERYIEHEEDVRRRLESFSNTGKPLSELKRVFLLDPALRPTRNSIMDIDYVRVRVRENWFYPDSPHEVAEAIGANRAVIDDFCDSIEWQEDEGSNERTPIQRHLVAEVPIRQVYENLLVHLRFASLNDAQGFLGVLLVVKSAIDNSEVDLCRVYRMSSGQVRERVLRDGEIPQLFQGAAPTFPIEMRGSVYPGDRALFSNEMPTVQIHNLGLREEPRGPIVYPEVSTVAVRVTSEMAREFIIQDQGDITEVDL